MITLRPYQERAVAALRASYSAGRRAPVLVAPTGAGKTIIGAYIIQSAVALGNRSLFVAPRRELIGQTVRKLAEAGVWDVRVIQGARDTGRPDAPVVVGSIQTLTVPRWLGRLPHADLVLADEAHHMAAAQWSQLSGAYPQALWLGLTATPERADGKGLGNLFDDLIVAATVAELTALGNLVPCRIFAPTTGAELETGELALDPVAAYQQHCAGELGVVFCATVEHAARTAADFNAAVVPAAVVSGSMPASDRDTVLRSWARGDIRVVCNCGVLTEGFDLPALSVCILARRFGHAGLYLQCIGRVLRPAPGKTRATVIDLCGSAIKHGPPEMEREYSLDGKAISSAAPRDAIRQCPRCGAIFLTAPACPQCGFELPQRPITIPRATGIGVAELPRSGAPAPARDPYVTTITAKRAGRCRRCFGAISPGDQIWWSRGDMPWHVACPTTRAA